MLNYCKVFFIIFQLSVPLSTAEGFISEAMPTPVAGLLIGSY